MTNLIRFPSSPAFCWQLSCKINNPKYRLQPQPSHADVNRLSARGARDTQRGNRKWQRAFCMSNRFLVGVFAEQRAAWLCSLLTSFVHTFIRWSALLVEAERAVGNPARVLEHVEGGGGPPPCWLGSCLNSSLSQLEQRLTESFKRGPSHYGFRGYVRPSTPLARFNFYKMHIYTINRCSFLPGSQRCWVSGVTLQRSPEGHSFPVELMCIFGWWEGTGVRRQTLKLWIIHFALVSCKYSVKIINVRLSLSLEQLTETLKSPL